MNTQDKLIRAMKKQPLKTRFLNGHSIKKVSQDINVSVNGQMKYLTLVSQSKIVDNIKGLSQKEQSVILYDSKTRMSGIVYPNLSTALDTIINHNDIEQHLLYMFQQSLHTTEEIQKAKEEFIQAMDHFHQNFS